jgi:ATPase family associated with various cellular activities (AAA)
VLFQLGAQSNSMRIDMGQRKGMIDELFTGNFLGVQADIASGELRKDELRTFSHLVGDYFVPPAFMDAVATHLVKNILADSQQAAGIAGSHRLRGVPLILGIWGRKGAGKSFNLELVCKKLGVTPVIVSAGELEDESAGQPGRRIRERYRTASQTIRNSGVMSALIINDLDAGCGRFKHTQVTVNNQVVMGTLMNLSDHPERASVGESWREDLTLRRVPIIITGNDLSTLYAPLLRDGRMAKFLWEPTREDIVGMLGALYKDDGLPRASVEALVDAFPEQPLDFFGALRARRYDATIREWVGQLGSEKEVNKRLLKGLRDEEDGVPTEGLPDFTAAGTATLLEAGRDLEREQETVLSMQLSREYQKNLAMEEGNGSGLTGFGGG